MPSTLFDSLSEEALRRGAPARHVGSGDGASGRSASGRVGPPGGRLVDRFVRLAAGVFEVEGAALMVSTAAGLRPMACFGAAGAALDQVKAVSARAIREDGLAVVCDAAAETEADAAHVGSVEPPAVRFVAAAPLYTPVGAPFGALCLVGAQPRPFGPERRLLFEDLTQFASEEVRLRCALPEKAAGVCEDRALLAAVIAAQRDIASTSLSPDEVLELVLRRAHALTGAEGAGVARAEGAELVYHKTVGTTQSCTGLRLDIDTTLSGHCLRTGEVFYVEDSEQDARVNREVARAVGIRSMIIMPLRVRGEVAGVLNVISGKPHAFRTEHVQALHLLTDLMAAALEQARARQEFRESERRYRALVEQTAEAIFFACPETLHVLEANAAFRELLGYTDEEVQRLAVYDFVTRPPESVDGHACHAMEGRPVTIESRWQRKDGRLVDVQVTVSTIRQDERDLLFIVARDITARKEAEEGLRLKEHRYRTLFERANVLIMIFTPDEEVILEANQQACRAYGFAREDLIGRSLRSLTADVNRGRQEIEEIVERGGTRNFETAHYRHDGSRMHLLTSCSLIRYDGADAILFFGRDITERKRAEEALRESTSRYQALIEQTAEAIYFIDPKTLHVQEANPAFLDMLGYEAADLKTLYDYEFVAHERRNVEALIERVMATQHPITVERKWKRKDGRLIDVRVTVSTIRRNGRELLFAVARDITERKQAEAMVRRSKARKEAILESALDCIITMDQEGRIIEFNPAAVRTFGCERDRAIGQPLDEIIVPPRLREAHRRGVARFLEGGHSCVLDRRVEVPAMRADGSEFPAELTITHTQMDEEPSFFTAYLRDITERKQAKEKLVRSEARLRAITSNATDMIEIIDPEGVIRYVSGDVQEVVGYAPAQLVGQPAFMNTHPEDLPALREAFAESLKHPGKVLEIIYRVRDPKRKWRYLSVHGRNLLDQPGIGGVLCNIRDVTEQKMFELELAEAKETAEEMARLKSAFLANMSHEIRTPLTGILGFADVLVAEVDGEQREFAELIRSSGQRLYETLNSVLDLARLEAGGVEMDLAAVDLCAVVRETRALFSQAAAQKQLWLRAELPEAPVLVEADEAALGRVVANVLSNALKFTEAGGVTLRVEATGGGGRLAVIDTGIGMSDAFLSELFDEFKQESTGLRRSHEGAGLGLAITKRLVELMGGAIAVESARGEGSTFAVTLAAAHVPAGPPARPRAEPAQAETAAAEAPAALRTVLAVEDNPDTRLLLRYLLRDAWQARIVATPEQALAEVAAQRFDVVLMDINLGGDMDGPRLLRALRAVDGCRHVPVVALTAYAMPGDRERFLADGFAEYLPKPFSRADLHAVLNRAASSMKEPRPA